MADQLAAGRAIVGQVDGQGRSHLQRSWVWPEKAKDNGYGYGVHNLLGARCDAEHMTVQRLAVRLV